MNTTPHKVKRRWNTLSFAATALASLCLLAPSTQAQNLFWDADGDGSASTGGAGTWDLVSSLWRLNNDTGPLQTYTNTAGAMSANFAGSTGTVTIASGLTINASVINITGNRTIAGGSGRFLNLDGTSPTIHVDGTSGYTGATISANITGSNGLNKTGEGFVYLSGANTYTGTTTVSDGTLRANDDGSVGLGAGNLVLNGGVFQSRTDFIRSLGTGDNQVSITGGTTGFGGGTSSTNIIAIGGIGTETELVWGSTHFNPDVFVLNNNGYSGTTVDLRNGIDLNGATRTINSTAQWVKMSGDITGSGGLIKTGGGSLAMSGDNTFTGGFTWIDDDTYTLNIGSDTAFGNGLVTLDSNTGAVNIRAEDATDRVLNNDVNITEGDLRLGSEGSGNLTFGNFTNGSGGQSIKVYNQQTTFSSYTAASGTFNKYGAGNLVFTGDFNRSGSDYVRLYDGALAIGGEFNTSAVTRLGASSTTGHLGWNGTMSANLGTAGSVSWTLNTNSIGGGLFAFGDNATWGNTANNLAVNFGGSGAEVTWGDSHFVKDGNALFLGHSLSNGTVDFQNALNLNGINQTIEVAKGDSNLAGGSDAILSGVVSNGSLTKTGTGTLKLTAENTYAGGTTVSAGTLLISNTSGSGLGTGSVSVDSGATLGGSGSFTGDLSINGGTLAPGASIESLGAGGITLSGGEFAYEINTSTLTADLLFASDNDVALNLSGTPTLNITDLGSDVALTAGTKFTLISYTAAGGWNNGTFDGYDNLSEFTLGANQWKINYEDVTAGINYSEDATDFGDRFVTLAVIPEPSTLAFLMLGLTTVFVFRKKRNA
ncbi:autotransporter-associated beta strand repeat-containing protein [Kiritimatiellota bacterium B12222]|nr:autotransporter-associated beta strand repeat-containing protein [Kiritimatiellota bacterium B12222]